MKKQIFLFAILLGACSLMANAKTQQLANQTKMESPVQEKKDIKAEELPEAVKKTLAGDSYKGWEISKASVAKDVYEVELKKGSETKTAKFDKDGKEVK